MKYFLDNETINSTIDKSIIHNKTIIPTASVIIVAYNPNLSLFEQTIKTLVDKTKSSYEILLIDNSEKSQLQKFAADSNLNYIKLNRNYGLTIGRNVGINYSQGSILIFLDDDAIPGKNFIDEHVKAHQDKNILALRGKCLPRTNSIFNHFASHYDLGNDVIPYFINLEGNSSFKKDILIEVGGFNTVLKGAGGHEGLEISKRIIAKSLSKYSIIYCPKAIIYHDYSKSLLHYLKKEIRHARHWKYIHEHHPDFVEFFLSYNPKTNSIDKDLDLITKSKILLIKKMRQIALRSGAHLKSCKSYIQRLKSNNCISQ